MAVAKATRESLGVISKQEMAAQAAFRRVVTGIGLGLVEALTKVYYPEASSMVMFLVMVLVLLVRPNGLFGGVE